MSFRIVASPLGGALGWPEERAGGRIPAALLAACHAGPGADDALAELRHPDTLVVTTGQQPGLFTGPLYTVYKALSAAALATRLRERWRRPVVPVFWSAGDDHDFAEANHASWPTADGGLRTQVLRTRAPDAPLTPMYREPLGPEVLEALTVLERDLGAADFGADAIAWLRRAYRPEATVAGAYVAALAELLGPAGVVVFESTHPAVKEASAPLLLRALEAAGDLDRDLAERAAELTERGEADTGVAVGDGATLVMLEGRLGRDRLVAGNGGFATRRGGERFELTQLRRIAETEPRRLSPNVLLRPVVESALLPTVAYLAGPGELRYLQLTRPIYDRFEVPRQRPVPRWSGVVVERYVDRVLEKFGIDLDRLLDPTGHLESDLVRARLPSEATGALEALHRSLEREYARLEASAGEVDPTLVRSVQRIRNQALAGASEIEKKLIRHLKRRQEVELGQIARARTAVRPGGKPQERVLTVATYLARHGSAFVDEVMRAVEAWYSDALEAAPVPS